VLLSEKILARTQLEDVNLKLAQVFREARENVQCLFYYHFKTSVFGKNLFSPSSLDKTNLIGSVSNFSEIAGRHLLATP
jgi:hypothetical protein